MYTTKTITKTKFQAKKQNPRNNYMQNVVTLQIVNKLDSIFI